jgi:tetratricopeptide (TPR) repeat protein/outer membrane protein OmpA-like peptidoglycan-associated protein
MKFSFLFIFMCLCFGVYAQEPKVIKKQADADFKAKKYEAAISGYSKLTAAAPIDIDVFYNRAVSYEKTNQTELAIGDYLVFLGMEKKDKAVHIKVADLYMKLSKYKDANNILEKLLVFDKDNIPALQRSAYCLILLKDFNKAVSRADLAIEEDSKDDGEFTDIAHYYRALAKDSLHDYPAALTSYKRAVVIVKTREINRLKALPKYKPYYVNLAKVQNTTRSYDEAIQNFDIAITLDIPDTILPSNSDVYYYNSLSYFAKSDFNNSIGNLNKAIVLNGKSQHLFFQRGLVYKATSQYQSAISDFTKASLLEPNNPLTYLYKGQCEMELGNFQNAIKDFKTCLKLEPSNNEAKNLLKQADSKYYLANKESDAPQVKISYPAIDYNNFTNIYVNQVTMVIEGQVMDKSMIKSIVINEQEKEFDKEAANPEFRFVLKTENLKKVEIVVTDIYNNTTTKTIKIGRIVSETRAIVSLEGMILSNDGSGKPLVDKQIFLTNHKGEEFYQGRTDGRGYFIFENLPVDKDYLIEVQEDDVVLRQAGFILADKTGKAVMKSSQSANNKSSFAFELLQVDAATMSLMSIDDVPLMVNISGRLMGVTSTQVPLPGVSLQLVRNNNEVVIRKTDENGYFTFTNLKPGENYSFKIDAEEARTLNTNKILILDYKGQVLKVISKNDGGFFEYKLLDVEKTQLSSITEPDPWANITFAIKAKKEFSIIENIYYESGSFAVPKASEVFIDKAVEALKANQKLTLQVESHTDAVAGDEFNLDLSQKRAASVVEYIQSKGIDKKRLVAKGMGETALTNHCANGVDCSDAEHKQNRRTVFKLIAN